jgi:hypothetical protein
MIFLILINKNQHGPVDRCIPVQCFGNRGAENGFFSFS